MYLETILILSESRPQVRSIDVVEYMGFSKPSVSRAVKNLRDGGYICVDKDGYITLSALGRDEAHKMYERHHVLTKLLISFGIDETEAARDACKIEHVISDSSFEKIKNFVKKL